MLFTGLKGDPPEYQCVEWKQLKKYFRQVNNYPKMVAVIVLVVARRPSPVARRPSPFVSGCPLSISVPRPSLIRPSPVAHRGYTRLSNQKTSLLKLQ